MTKYEVIQQLTLLKLDCEMFSEIEPKEKDIRALDYVIDYLANEFKNETE